MIDIKLFRQQLKTSPLNGEVSYDAHKNFIRVNYWYRFIVNDLYSYANGKQAESIEDVLQFLKQINYSHCLQVLGSGLLNELCRKHNIKHYSLGETISDDIVQEKAKNYTVSYMNLYKEGLEIQREKAKSVKITIEDIKYKPNGDIRMSICFKIVDSDGDYDNIYKTLNTMVDLVGKNLTIKEETLKDIKGSIGRLIQRPAIKELGLDWLKDEQYILNAFTKHIDNIRYNMIQVRKDIENIY